MHRAAKPSHLPPLNSLRAFEAAARHANFRKAAAELHVTPAAVSHQVKALEDHLGVQLFYRQPRALQLTPAARACLPQLREGFGALAAAAELMRSGARRETLLLEVAPSFAVKWLGRRIDRFVSAHPDIDLHIEAKPQGIDGRAGELERNGDSGTTMRRNSVAIVFGSGRYPGCRSEKLSSVTVTPMCAPRLCAGDRPLCHPRDLRYHTLLHDDMLNLDDGRSRLASWLSAAGVDGIDIARGPHFNHAALALEAAADGVGVVLSYPLLAAADLAAGRLIAPFGLAVPLEQAYYLVYQHAASERASIAAFRAWLLKEVRAVTAG
jgi:LysR family glycine cleavage system transcriptional activator